MGSAEKSQSEYEFDFYDDLDVVTDGKIGVDIKGTVEYVILTINGKEIKIEGEAADSIHDALEVRVNNKLQDIIKTENQNAAILAYEVSKRDEYEMRLMEKGA